MKISRECIHCLAKQAVEIAEEVTSIESKQEEIIKKSLKSLSDLDFNLTAPEIAYKMHQHAKRITGIKDPYKNLKDEYNKSADEIAKQIRQEKWIESSEDQFDTACRLSIAGNIIDFSVGLDIDHSDIVSSVKNSMKHDLFGSGSSSLKKSIENADKIMFLADNAGEIIFDRFLIEQLPLEKVTLVVKGEPIVNDATMKDAVSTGLAKIVKVIDNGHGAQGTVLSECSPSFQKAFEESDLIISKGQANFETLSDIEDKDMYFLLRAKCKSVANAIGCDHMDYVLTNNM